MLKIVVVDDSLIIRKNIAKMLERMNHKIVAEAKNGQEAIVCCNKLTPDLITMDITMPDMDGIEAVKEIIKKNAEAKIIMVTSHGQEEMVMAAIRAGASGYVLKPVNAEKLTQAIKRIFPNEKLLASSVVQDDGEDDIVIHEGGDEWIQDLDNLSV
jgi:two-component system chemotaxis response regulator CheY